MRDKLILSFATLVVVIAMLAMTGRTISLSNKTEALEAQVQENNIALRLLYGELDMAFVKVQEHYELRDLPWKYAGRAK